MTSAVTAVRFGPFQLQRDERRLLKDGATLVLWAHAFDVAQTLAYRGDAHIDLSDGVVSDRHIPATKSGLVKGRVLRDQDDRPGVFRAVSGTFCRLRRWVGR